MKLLFLGLIPVLIFWAVEEKFGTFWGIVAAVVWAIGECGYEYAKHRKVEKLTLFSTGLTVGLGVLAAWLDQGVLFKFQPVIIELAFAAVLVWSGRGGEPLLFKMAVKTRPEIFENLPPETVATQKQTMVNMTRHLVALLFGHSLLLSYMAVRGTTGQWAFWKGVGFNVFVVLWVAGEYVAIRRRMKNRPQNLNRDDMKR